MGGASGMQDVIDLIRTTIQKLSADLNDLSSKIEQSRGPADQLAQRHATLMSEVRRIEGVLEDTPRTGIKDAYVAALDSQQRLLTMRGQLEKLQAQESSVRQSVLELETLMEKVMAFSQGAVGSSGGESKPTLAPREMIARVINAQEEERDRLARQMHDGPVTAISNFILQAEILQKNFDKNPDKVRKELTNVMDAARETFKLVRGYVFDLHPMMLSDLGLAPTVKRYITAFKDNSAIEIELAVNGTERRLEPYLEILLFRGIQELLVNARDHSGANMIKINLDIEMDQIDLLVEDNGKGFGTGKLTLDAASSKTIGLSTLQERVQLAGGTMQLDSTPGQGSRIAISIPAGSVSGDNGEFA
jgi:two-component system sensor histidine kinase DegS